MRSSNLGIVLFNMFQIGSRYVFRGGATRAGKVWLEKQLVPGNDFLLSPLVFACWMDEDFIGRISRMILG